jgi:hypothetical protein
MIAVMGSRRITPMIPNLFSRELPREQAALTPSPTIPAADSSASSPRHILPSDLPAAIKHLNNQELEQLLAAVTAEQQRRGNRPPAPKKIERKRMEAPSVSLTIGKLNAVRAAFKAGVTPARIARQFGITQSEVRHAIASEAKK